MYQLDEKVVYANYGVCIVSQVDAPMTFGGVERSYYVLTPTRKRGGTVYVPTDHEELMRPVMSRAEALSLIDSLASIQIDDVPSRIISAKSCGRMTSPPQRRW